MSGIRSTARWQALCREMIPRATVCALCHGFLDHAARPRTPRSPSLDHVVPISRGGAPFDRSNLQVSHYGCNARKGNRQVVAARPVPAPMPEPALTDCNGIWPHRNADIHAWVAGYCRDPDNCPRCERAGEAARRWVAATAAKFANR